MIHLYEDDPRFISDWTFADNHGSFSVINYGINNELKKINKYSDLRDSEWVGIPSSLNFTQQFSGKKMFYITVWETINKLTNFHIDSLKGKNKILLGMSDQVSDLYKKEGIRCETLHCGCDTDFWKPTTVKNKKFTFVHVNSSNVRSGLDLTVKAFHSAFQNNSDVQLIIKDTNENNSVLMNKIKEFQDKGSQIIYVSRRWTKQEVRDLYSSSHVGLNLLRMTSWGFPLHEMPACGTLTVTGDFSPTNVLVNKNYGILIKPSKEVDISEKLPELCNQWGLINCYGNFSYSEQPRFYDFDIEEYTSFLKNIYANWSIYQNLDLRSPIVNQWKWSDTVKNLIEILEKHELAS